MEFRNEFFEELAASESVGKLTKDAADKVASAARATAPVDSGDYQRGIVVRTIRRRKVRTVSLVVGTDPKTMLIESKTGNLARALRTVRRAG